MPQPSLVLALLVVYLRTGVQRKHRIKALHLQMPAPRTLLAAVSQDNKILRRT